MFVLGGPLLGQLVFGGPLLGPRLWAKMPLRAALNAVQASVLPTPGVLAPELTARASATPEGRTPGRGRAPSRFSRSRFLASHTAHRRQQVFLGLRRNDVGARSLAAGAVTSSCQPEAVASPSLGLPHLCNRGRPGRPGNANELICAKCLKLDACVRLLAPTPEGSSYRDSVK